MRRSPYPLLAALVFLFAIDASAQEAPPRPRLAAAADSNDWTSYFDCARKAKSEKRFDACIHWAHRLEPSRPEPLYLAYLMEPEKRDSMRTQALYRDPFFYHARILTLEERKPGIFTKPSPDRAWRALSAGNYFNAATIFQAVLKDRPDLVDERWGLAIAQYYRRNFDSAATHLGEVYAALEQARDTLKVENTYRSLDFLAYMHAVALHAAGRPADARAALQRALGENLAFHRAHAMLGDLAIAGGDTAAADDEWRQTRELVGDDADGRMRVARYLMSRGRHAEAERELRELLALEPYWSAVRFELARAIDAQGTPRRADAARAWADYLKTAPTGHAEARALAEQRIGVLGEAP